ncbi:hypothetical protein NKI59_11795 [Mesorhizobium sp. M0598]|uniref:hypothetical protein n=1 Tax=Mesorhizobium sp. M0598 TaxID=2956968 RepID=UPI0033359316
MADETEVAEVAEVVEVIAEAKAEPKAKVAKAPKLSNKQTLLDSGSIYTAH